jgi:hypothetical protein
MKECKSEYNKETCTPMFIAPLVTIAKQQPRCPTTDENEYIYIYIYIKLHNGILFSHKWK